MKKIMVIIIIIGVLLLSTISITANFEEENKTIPFKFFKEGRLEIVNGEIKGCWDNLPLFIDMEIRTIQNPTIAINITQNQCCIPIDGNVFVTLFNCNGCELYGWTFSLCIVRYL